MSDPERVVVRPFGGAADVAAVRRAHRRVYTAEFGWGDVFDAYVKQTLDEFAARRDPAAEELFIAERDGALVGCVGVVRAGAATAQLRWLLTTAEARGGGLGKRLVELAIDFARARGYRHMILWTERSCTAARAIYGDYGFACTEEKASDAFGLPVVEEKWERPLD